MIASFRDAWLEDFFRHNVVGKQIPAAERDRVFRRLQMLDDATCDRDLRSPPGNHFERLSPPLDGRCSIRVSRQWRLVFEFDGTTGRATGVYLDPHTYRI
ncbi:type II toxin-antitoxin system RelE/ParE family toxin [Azospirillum halopraeferens]|uniref:type II toxin-antitoxin system RelE/ParE family toxin n=1 Tax=Azospirillum halopraeferens TaxID=34010 RepID=UPI00048F8E30|nr:type II toxin-antitoxin system RelE/ParE family toxin [Azospirillum halopraeferens]